MIIIFKENKLHEFWLHSKDIQRIEVHERHYYLEMAIKTKNDNIIIYDKEFKFTTDNLHYILKQDQPFFIIKVKYISYEQEYDKRILKMEISDWITTAIG
jgi:hypothetical protein